jgi:uncharacterized Zn-finger protein
MGVVEMEKSVFKECRVCGESLSDGILYLKHLLLHTNNETGSNTDDTMSSNGDLLDDDFEEFSTDDEQHSATNDSVNNNNMSVEDNHSYEEYIGRIDADASNREGIYVCKICGKEFRKKYSIVCHLKVHTGERPYQCPTCSRSASVISYSSKLYQ